MVNKPQGSLWRKWDLHVHTPLSLYQKYGGDTPRAWDRFFKEIEALPPEVKVLGINDYIFIDGYQKVIDARENGRLSNIDLVLPVIELRIDLFGGTDSGFKRINYHVIFSNEISPRVIRSQFIGTMTAQYQLSPVGKKWNGAVTDVESLQEFGEWLIESTPEDKRNSLPSPLEFGFANLNYTLTEVNRCLEHHNFANK